MNETNPLSRRILLRAAALAAGGAVLTLPEDPADAQENPYAPFRMGIQSYSLRGYNLDQALEETQKLGLRYWESFNAHLPFSPEEATVKAQKERLAAARIRVLAYGVVPFGSNTEANRQLFEGAKALGIPTLSADPAPESMDQLEKLVEEFRINIAIHNHGPRHRYGSLQSCVDAVKGRHERIGVCVDTGHFLRSSENPVKVIETLGTRVLGVHLKDVKDARVFTIVGKGDLDVVGTLRALKALSYRHLVALEYEENPRNPIADIQECLAAVRAAAQKL
ncbi:MAG: sugar phosphate isomerase/epimerase [Armatimonadetes bacterium]|nr:sugar phosphate isomerase/epimerase [Armatimonadota bacterium]